MMKKMHRKAVILVLVMVMIVGSALPAQAASKWYGWNRCTNTTIQFSTGKTANYRILTQKKGTVLLRNTITGKTNKSMQAYGTYRVTIVQIRDANGRTCNKKICTNSAWISQYFNKKLTKGTYRVTVRGLGVVTPARAVLGSYTASCWKSVPVWRVG